MVGLLAGWLATGWLAGYTNLDIYVETRLKMLFSLKMTSETDNSDLKTEETEQTRQTKETKETKET